MSWGREYGVLKAYFTKNFLQSKGLGWRLGQRGLSWIALSLKNAGVGPPSMH